MDELRKRRERHRNSEGLIVQARLRKSSCVSLSGAIRRVNIPVLLTGTHRAEWSVEYGMGEIVWFHNNNFYNGCIVRCVS